MEHLGVKFDAVYRKIGERTALLAIFFIGVFVHTFFALKMEMISVDPNEFGVLAWSALFGGKNWSGIMSMIEYYYGYAGTIIYTPLFLIIKNPFIFYKAVLILNGVIVSVIPVIAFRIGGLLGMNKAWNRILVALVCGLYSTVFAHTKFAWNETACIILPWIMIFLLLKSDGIKPKNKKRAISVFTAFATVFTQAAHPRLIGVAAATIIVILFARFVMKKKLVNLNFYFIPLIGFAVGEVFLRNMLGFVMWGEKYSELQNTFASFFGSFAGFFSADGFNHFCAALFGHLYYLVTSTWGLGSLAVCIAFAVIYTACGKITASRRDNRSLVYDEKYDSYIIKNERKEKKAKRKTEYTDQFILFAVFALTSNILAIAASVIDKFGSDGLTQYQDIVIFGRYMDSIVPMLIMLVISYVFIYSLDLTKLLATFIVSGTVYSLFFIFTVPAITGAKGVRVSPILGLYPVRIGERIDAIITLDGLLLTVSCVFCFIALFIVIVCCSNRYRRHIISLCMVFIMLYSSLYTATVYLPFAASEAKEINTPIYELSEHIYNATEAPYVYTYKTSRRTSTLLQFLNRDTKVFAVTKLGDLPENCFIVVPDNERLALKPNSEMRFRELVRTDSYTLYAYGEKANAYAQSQESEY